jgi:chemotaxis protein MotB
MAGAGGGAWKVAYADFVTAMMAFFLVMWITGQSQEVKEAVSGYFQDPWGTSSENTGSSSSVPGRFRDDMPIATVPGVMPPKQSQDEHVDDPVDSAPNSRWAQRRSIRLLNTPDHNLPVLIIPFDEASAALTDAAQQRLHPVLASLLGKPNRIEIRAHTSQRPLPAGGPFQDHWQLCYARSTAIMNYLQSHGVEPERIRLSQSSPFEPLTTRLESAWQDENDCVELFMLSEVVDTQLGRGQAPPKHDNAPADAPVGRAAEGM